jgi:nucleotide-binding universal stress UspA family protein
MKTILVLIDFSDVTRKVLDQALAMAKAFGSDIALMHVVPEEPVVVDFAPAPMAPDPDVFNARQRQLFALRDSLKTHGINVTAQQFGGVLLNTLLDQIEQLNPDIIIMGSHGHGALYHLLVGSVTESVIKHATRPVLVVPSAPAPQQIPAQTVTEEKEQAKLSTMGALGGMPVPL